MSTNEELLKKYFTEDGRVICQYCLKTFKRITASHLVMHNMTYDEYRFKFPGAPLDRTEIINFISDKKPLEVPVIKKPDNVIKTEIPAQLSPKDIINQIKDNTIIEEKLDVVEFVSESDEVKFQHKGEVITFMKKYLPGLRNNYFYKKTNIAGEVLFTFVTDMADPQRRIVIDFPDTFWHNRDFYFESRKAELLKQSKWRYIIIDGVAPTNQEIVDALNK